MRPPISALWQVLANRAASRPSLKTGVVIVISLICPAVIHGSLVMSTSPGESVSAGNAARKWRIEVAMALMWPGVPLTDWAIILPLVSNIPQARSWLSRTIVLKAVRISASCCSVATERRRFQMTSRVTASSACPEPDRRALLIGELHDDVEPVVDPAAPAGADDQSGFALFDNGRPGKRKTRSQGVAVIHRRLHIASVLGKIGRARAFRGEPQGRTFPALAARGGGGQMKIHLRLGAAGDHAPVDHLDRDIRTVTAVERPVDFLKGRVDPRQMPLAQNAVRQRDGNLVALADIAHIGAALVGNSRGRKTGTLQHGPPLSGHLAEETIDKTPVQTIQTAVGAAHEVEGQRRHQQPEGRAQD